LDNIHPIEIMQNKQMKDGLVRILDNDHSLPLRLGLN